MAKRRTHEQLLKWSMGNDTFDSFDVIGMAMELAHLRDFALTVIEMSEEDYLRSRAIELTPEWPQ
jgi:hypothetical protein